MAKLILVFLGPPGVGKGTQAAKLAADIKLPHISTGDLFRDHLKRETPLGLKAKEYMNKGNLVPDQLVVDLTVERIDRDDCAGGYILDGFPRTLAQGDAFEKALEERGDEISGVISLDAPRESIIERISGRRTCKKCGAMYHVKYAPAAKEGVCDKCAGETYQREDDREENVATRLKVYDKDTGPLVPYYRERGKLTEIDASGGIDEIYARVKAAAEALKA